MKPSIMKTDLADEPPSRSCGAKPLKAAMAMADPPSRGRRPTRSAMKPEATIAATPKTAPTVSMIRNRAGPSLREQEHPGQREHRDHVEQGEARQRREGADARRCGLRRAASR